MSSEFIKGYNEICVAHWVVCDWSKKTCCFFLTNQILIFHIKIHTFYQGSECVIQEEARRKFGPIKCSFTDIMRIDDFELSDGETTTSTEYYKLEKSDVVRASCQSADHKWSATLTGIRLDNDIWDKSSWEEMRPTALKMNVLMFGYDSLSKNAFIRKLPKTYQYLTKKLGAVILEG